MSRKPYSVPGAKADRIASRLTMKQRSLLLRMSQEPAPYHIVDGWTRTKLFTAEILYCCDSTTPLMALTPLGLEVRSILEQDNAG